jgi:hypothetical protein
VNGKLPVDQAPTSILIRQKVNPPPATSRKTSTDALRKALSLFPPQRIRVTSLTDSEVSFPCGWLNSAGGDPRVVDDDGKSKGESIDSAHAPDKNMLFSFSVLLY